MIALMTSGKYISIKSMKKLKKIRRDKIEYLLINVDTNSRVDVYTMIRGDQIADSLKSNINKIELDLNYSSPDCGYDPDRTIHYKFTTNNIFNQFNIYPMIRQISDINSYKDMVGEFCSDRLTPIRVTFKDDGKEHEWNEKYLEDGPIDDPLDLDKIFRKNNLKTHTRSLRNDYIIFRNYKWEFMDNIPLEFDFIGYPIRDSENIQLISFEDFNKLMSIDDFNINVDLYVDMSSYDKKEPDGVIEIYENDIETMLAHMFYLRTVLELDRYFDDSTMYDVTISIGAREYTISPEDYHYNKHSSYAYIPFSENVNGVSYFKKLMQIL